MQQRSMAGPGENRQAARDLPRVTAIIPCFNRASYLGQAVESILSQSYPHIETVVIDDGCTDGSREILESFGDRITLLEHPGRENRGQSAGINLGLSRTHGDYVAILDSDDVWLPHKIAEQVEYLEAHPDVGLVYGCGEAIDENGKHLYRIHGPDHVENSDPNRVLMDCYFLVPNNSLVRRSVFDRIGGFDESLRAAQDHDIAIRIAEVTRLAFLPRLWFQYRRHKDSISRNRAEVRWRSGFRIVEKARRRYPYPRHVVRGRKGVLHFRLAQCLLEQSRLLPAGWHLASAFVCDPLRSLKVLAGRERVTSPH